MNKDIEQVIAQVSVLKCPLQLHQDQTLELICLNRQCKQYLCPLCSSCAKSHEHKDAVVPLPKFLDVCKKFIN